MPENPARPARPARRLSLLYAVLRGCLAGFVAAWALELVYIFIGANVHVVAAGAVYRSARLDPAELVRVVHQYKIRTLVNLCGCSDPEAWYLDESRATCRLDICQEDVGLSAGRLPSVQAVRRLVEILDRCDYPILIHCHRGIDRTGLASTAALLLHTNAGLAEARRQLGLRYGHLAYGRTSQIDRFFDLYQEWLNANGQTHSPDAFRRWAEGEYCPGEGRCAIALLEPRKSPLHFAAGQPIAFRIRCTNTSIEPWVMQAGTTAGVHAAWVLLDDQDNEIYGGRSGLFDRVVRPGEAVDLTVAPPPLGAGRYRLQVDMNDEQHAYFYQMGASEPLTLELEVR